MKNFPLCLLSGCLSIAVVAGPLRAQSPGAAKAGEQAYELFSAGDYQAAATAYETLLKNYPTDAIAPGAQVQLAFAYYFLTKFNEAEAILRKALSLPVLTPEAKQMADGFLPQILSAKAAAMPESDAGRKAAFEKAIASFTDYIKKYPKADDLESAMYGRAIAEYQVGKYDDVVKDLEFNLSNFPKSATIPSTKNLLAITLATQGSTELGKGDAADKAKAFALYKRAADYLREIIANRSDIALINEANFQLGEILLNQAAFSPEADRPALYAEALAAFRAVAGKDQIIEWQKEVLSGFPERKRQALQARNVALKRQLDRENERELKKLAELQGKPDQLATALAKTAEIYFRQNEFNQARVVLQHVEPFLTTPEDKKSSLYYTTMTYALQGVADRAESGYQNFLSQYKADPIADNLPISMGNMYLGSGKPQDAVKYFDAYLAAYPNGRLTGLAVLQKATAQTQLNQADEAARTFQSYLAKNPPPDLGVIAQSGLAGIYKDTQKWDDAIAAYKTVKEKYAGTPQAVAADYWIAVCTQQKGDHAAAIPMLEAFLKANPKNELAPLALYAKGGAQIALGKRDDGIATLAELAEQFPESQPAPFTYFMRAQLRGEEGKADDVIALMRQFIEKYPKDDKIYFAYDRMGQTALNAGKTDESLTVYREFADKYPDSPQAGEALFKVAEIQRTKANSLGRYAALNENERSLWKTLVDGSVETSESMVGKYPDSPALALALGTLLQSQRMLLGAELKTPPEVETYFQNLANSAPTPNAKSKILFALASYVAEQDKAKALALMNEAYNPAVVYSPKDLDIYGLALVEEKKYAEAAEVFEKLGKDYPNPANAPAQSAPPVTQEAQATRLFGLGKIAQDQGQTAEAGKLFEQLKALYPWSPKKLEADFGIAQALKAQGKLDEALALVGSISRATTVTAEIRADAMLLGGAIMVDKMNAATDPKAKADFLGAAIDYYLKISQFFGGVPVAAAEGLWRGGQLLEKQANESTDAKFKAQQLGRAKAAYQQLIKEYPNSEHVPKAQERVTALGGS